MEQQKNILENITSIEMGPMVVDSNTQENFLIIQSKRSRYCFKLSNTVNMEKQFEMFRLLIQDLSTDLEEVKKEPSMDERLKEANDGLNKTLDKIINGEEPKEKHDGAKLFDEPPTFNPTDVEITVKE